MIIDDNSKRTVDKGKVTEVRSMNNIPMFRQLIVVNWPTKWMNLRK